MNQAEVEDVNHTMLTRVADRIARALCAGARKGLSKKQLLAIAIEQIRSVRVRCPACMTDVPVMLLGRDDARHVCIVARRTNFVNLRRRLEDHFLKARLMCPSCKATAQDLATEVVRGYAGDGPCETSNEAAGAVCAAGTE